MAIQPVEWNVVVAGAWNRAILTPQGIAKRLFEIPPEAGVEVQVALDGLGPMRVLHAGMIVIPGPQLIVQPEAPSLGSMLKAAEIAARAVNGLPETPLRAAGINMRFAFSVLPDSAIEAGNTSRFDERLAESGESVSVRTTKRTLRWGQAELNLEIVESEDVSGVVLFNFHRASTSPTELTEWINQVQAMHEHMVTLLRTLLGVKLQPETGK